MRATILSVVLCGLNVVVNCGSETPGGWEYGLLRVPYKRLVVFCLNVGDCNCNCNCNRSEFVVGNDKD